MQTLGRVVERIRAGSTFEVIAAGVIAELAAVYELREIAVVICDADGRPARWIGDAGTDRVRAQAHLDRGDDPCLPRLCATHAAIWLGDTWVAPILGAHGVIGMLRAGFDRSATELAGKLVAIATHISIRLAILGDGHASIEALTPRQREVAELVAHGCTNAEIARMLDVTAHAVKKHVSRVLEVLGVTNRTELAALTGRWRGVSGIGHILPSNVQVVVRNSAKPYPSRMVDRVA